MNAVKNVSFESSLGEKIPRDFKGLPKEIGWKRAHKHSEAKVEGINPPPDKKTRYMFVEKKAEWNIPSGFHEARIIDARLMAKSGSSKEQGEMRFLFEITSMVHPTRKYLAKKVYKEGDSKQIITDLEHLLGDDINRVINLQGEIIANALTSLLRDKEVDIEIEHHRGKNYNEPFCLVTQVTNPGVLIERLDDAA